MAMIDRIRAILVEPRSEWPEIAAEPATVQSIYTGWILILGAIAPVAMLVGYAEHGVLFALRVAVSAYVTALVLTFVLAMAIDVLAPSFGGERDFVASLKLVAYSCTAVWLAGIAHVLGIFAHLVMWIAAVYALYTFFVGAPLLRKCSADRAIPFALIVALCAIALFVVAGYAMGARRPF
ncbi:MAG: YIP1 family protein [Burkholderiales bacterium]|jgi:hypothetical protein|nr:YIP1 family protein [Burkholderiales bacterium]